MKKAYPFYLIALALFIMASCQKTEKKALKGFDFQTYCNPIDLSYRFCIDQPSRREAADPTVIIFKNEHFLFASKSGGYWNSTDLLNWQFITTSDLPTEDYAPSPVVIGDTIYFMASSQKRMPIYKTTDPKSGKWQIAHTLFPFPVWDPDLFLDDGGRLYLYWGCSNVKPIYAIELDLKKNLSPIGQPVECFNSNTKEHGWEQTGDYNNLPKNPWIEGSWMTKHNGKYYLQYAGPGTEYKSYADGVYVSDKPLGPFKYAENNPFSYKPEGFIAGAGHSSTFQDKYGNYWHVVTMTISQKHIFERRLGLLPTFFDNDGTLFTYTGFGDFPIILPNKKISGPDEIHPQWMILSYNKPVEASSAIDSLSMKYASDENIRTYWSAKTGNKGEWLSIDLQKEYQVNAVQINYAEHNTKFLGRDSSIYHQYLLEYSTDNTKWEILADKTQNKQDVPHNYIQLKQPVMARFIKLTNYRVPDGNFALSGLRVFGIGQDPKPSKITDFNVSRDSTDKRIAHLSWPKISTAIGYNIRFGAKSEKLYHNYMFYSDTTLTIRSLNSNQDYYFSIDAFNENGVNKGEVIKKAE